MITKAIRTMSDKIFDLSQTDYLEQMNEGNVFVAATIKQGVFKGA